MRNTTWGRAAFTAGPLCMVAYGLLRLIDDRHGPGPDWSLGHLALLAGLLLFVPVFAGLRDRAARGRGPVARALAASGAVVGLAGAAAGAVQAAVDLAVAYCSADRATMDRLFAHVQSVPGVMPVVYTVGPVLFYVGLVLLLVQLAAQRAIAPWRPVAVVAGVVVTAATLDLIPVGGLLFLLALAPLGPRGEDGVQPAVRSSATTGTSRPPRAARSLKSAKEGSTAI
ncbi:hypothetical protein [Streptomyces sp. NPDC049585]|uniref:hypothetical protein n=1 Tax=Streptomyces sp. NPDC049585 TaxID=3155154 RepID=UPI00344927E4